MSASGGPGGCCWAALYTKQLRKKQKIFHDGFVMISSGGREACLLDEGGTVLARAAAPPSLQDDEEDVTLFEGFLVNLDGRAKPPGASDVPPCVDLAASHPNSVTGQPDSTPPRPLLPVRAAEAE